MRVFTNGCFDILHRGHVELFQHCDKLAIPAMGGSVIVGLNSDESVRLLKGDDRPINNEIDRKYLIESLKYVYEVIIFNEETPYELIKKIKPDVLVKGGDYDANITDINDPKYIVGSDIVPKVSVFNYISGYSTTNIINKNK